MCGISGVIGTNIENKDKVIGDMVSAIIHRGPDQDGFFVDEDLKNEICQLNQEKVYCPISIVNSLLTSFQN